MAKEMKVPDIGGFEGVEVIDVLVSEGDKVEKEDSLITLESDKAAMDVPAPFSGMVKELKVKAGDKVAEGDVILIADTAGEDGEEKDNDKEEKSESSKDGDKEEKNKGGEEKESKEKRTSAKDADESKASGESKSKEEEKEKDEDKGRKRDREKKDESKDEEEEEDQAEDRGGATSGDKRDVADSGRKPISPPTVEQAGIVNAHAGPSVRKFARELGVNLSQVKGSGSKGRVTHEDVKRYVKGALKGGAAGLPTVPEVDFARFGEVEEKPLSRIQRISGPRLQAAWVNVPHVTQHDEADMTALEVVRKALNADAGNRGVKFTPLAFLVRAVVRALDAYPDVNSSLDAAAEKLIVRRYFHIGFAVDTDQGLVVPVIRNADKKDLTAIAEELAELGEKARAGKLKRDDIEGACFTITSLGSIGGTAFTPIVNAPEVAILGVSRAEMKPKWNGSDFEPRLMLPLSLSYDHRVVDGAQAVHFTRHLADTIETLRGLVD
ncbi:MAG: 2-oxo acid dehydrogenase subunit E2 [Gammaproteobacteria bacterium]